MTNETEADAGLWSGEGGGAGDPGGDGVAVPEVFVGDAGEAFRGDATIPGAFGVNDEPGAAGADAEASGFGAEDGEVELFDEGFEGGPRGLAGGGGAAVGAEAEEGVAAGGGEIHFGETGGHGCGGGGGRDGG